MKLDQAIQQHLEKLPLPLQGEVLDYVLYLEQKSGKPSPDDSERRKSQKIWQVSGLHGENCFQHIFTVVDSTSGIRHWGHD